MVNKTKVKSLLILFVVLALAAIALYFFAQAFFPIGVVLTIFGAVIVVMGMQNKSADIFIVGAIILIIGLAFALLGMTGITLFKLNPIK